jgi:inosose dehydratase
MAHEVQFRFGAEVYTWFMHNNGDTYQGQLTHMINMVAKAGFQGIEPIHFWMGDLSDPARLSDSLNEAGIKLAAIALALDWNGPDETDTERDEADRTIALLKYFPDALLCMVQKPTGRHDLITRRQHLINIVNSISRRAAEQGLQCSFHPNSPNQSITRTPEDYAVILESLDAQATGWTPDVGHLINGGMDPLRMMKVYKALINHVHFKDWDGEPEFTLMGKGTVDFISITNWLNEIAFNGWIICEDEGKEALENPDAVTLHDGHWIHATLLPQLK